MLVRLRDIPLTHPPNSVRLVLGFQRGNLLLKRRHVVEVLPLRLLLLEQQRLADFCFTSVVTGGRRQGWISNQGRHPKDVFQSSHSPPPPPRQMLRTNRCQRNTQTTQWRAHRRRNRPTPTTGPKGTPPTQQTHSNKGNEAYRLPFGGRGRAIGARQTAPRSPGPSQPAIARLSERRARGRVIKEEVLSKFNGQPQRQAHTRNINI